MDDRRRPPGLNGREGCALAPSAEIAGFELPMAMAAALCYDGLPCLGTRARPNPGKRVITWGTGMWIRRFSGLVALMLALGGCAGTWDQFKQAVLPSDQESGEDIEAAEIAVLSQFETAAGPAADRHPAALHMEQLAAEVIDGLTDETLPADRREDLFRDILARDLDIPMIGKFVLGRHWRAATEDQRQTYLEAFSKYIVAIYAKRLGGIRVAQFEVIGAKSLGTKDILVRSRVVNGGKKPVRADWRVRERESTFRIVDLSVEGISMALTLRQEFQSVLRRKEGIEGLISLLMQRST